MTVEREGSIRTAEFEAGPDGMDVVAIGGPKPEGGDGERAEVSWPDG